MKSKFVASGMAIVLGVAIPFGDVRGAIAVEREGTIAQTPVDARKVEADRLYQKGLQQIKTKGDEAVLQLFTQALDLYRGISDFAGEANVLSSIGLVYAQQQNYPKSLENYQKALAVLQKSVDRRGEDGILNDMAIVHRRLGNYAKALDAHQQALIIRKKTANRQGEGATLNAIGVIYDSLGDYPTALDFYQRALMIRKEVSDTRGEIITLENIGGAYSSMGNSSKAFEFYQRVLKIADRYGVRNSVISGVSGKFSDGRSFSSDQKIYPFDTSLGLGGSLGGICDIQFARKNYAEALEFCERALRVHSVGRDRYKESGTLQTIGAIHTRLADYSKALEFYQRALVINKETGDLAGEGSTLVGIGYLMTKQKQPELAIVILKEAVNVRERIRQNLRPLSRDLKNTYAEKISSSYRSLADLLIQQGRIIEAQQVLELLKTQELNELDPKQRANPQRLAELALNPTEQEIQKQHDNLIAFGEKVRNCTENCEPLETQQRQLNKDFKTYVANLRKATETTSTFRIDDRNKDFIASASKIVNAQPGTVLIYPLVLPDKTHLLWASQGGILSSVTCPMGETALNTTIAAFTKSLNDRTDLNGVKQHGKTLYDCLIKPLEEKGEWQKNNIKNLVIAADRTINYIPIAALHDGKQFLIERYTTSNILNAGLTDVTDRLPKDPKILGIGISDSLDGLSALPNVETELNAIVRTPTNTGLYPGTLSLNANATPAKLKTQLKQNYNILHIATHGQFNPTEPNESFLLFSSGTPGKGDRYTINRIDEQQEALRKIHLVILSACQTASGQSATTGIEIQGLSAAFVRDRAKSVIASLWNVDDSSTALLMQQFYKNLTTGMTKAQAMQAAQLQFIQGKLTAKDSPDRAGGRRSIPGQPPVDSYIHPYYWAPFILIGNSQ